MKQSIGVVLRQQIQAGLVEGHDQLGALREPSQAVGENGLIDLPTEELCRLICDLVEQLAAEHNVKPAVGLAVPGMVSRGIIDDCPNLPQLKGASIVHEVSAGLKERGLDLAVTLCNDADAEAAGIAATRRELDHRICVWTIGNGIGFGRHPYSEGAWEGGHMVVTLDPRERFCACGGSGHLEGIMGNRAMRLRFLDMEPNEVFVAAQKGDKRCAEFIELWHRALAAATASQIHLEGPGRFYYTGRDIDRLDLRRLRQYLEEMVKLSPLQSYAVEILPEDRSRAVIGAAVIAADEAAS